MSHYFKNDRSLKDDFKTIHLNIKDESLVLETNAGVFSKERVDFGTLFLVEQVKLNHINIKNIIDMGCGYGPIGLFLAKKYPNAQVHMYDINESAVALTLKNIIMNNITNAQAIVSNLFEQVEKKGDLIITNPPIRTGKKNLFKLYEDAYHNLNSNGYFYLVIQKKQGALSTVSKLEELFPVVEIVKKSKGYWVVVSQK